MKTAFLCSLVLVVTPFASAKSPADLQRRLDEWIKGQSGGVAAAWIDAEGVTFAQSGRFDGGNSPAITPDTQFQLGSITKVFTALLLAESERLGKVRRADPAAKYLLPRNDPDQAVLAKITLLSLTTHTSGLPWFSSNLGPNPGANPDTYAKTYAKYDRALLVEGLRRDGASAPAGRRVTYSNFGAAVLGEALASAWRTSYPKALRAHVLDPLGLKATTLGMAGLTPLAGCPPGHVGSKSVPGWTFQAYAPAGALRSSAREMAVFLTACLGKGAGPLHAAIEATVHPQRTADDMGGQIGLGWFITDEGVVWHGGATAGSRAFVAFNPKAGAGLVILANVELRPEPLGFGLLGAKPPQPKVETVKGATDYVGRYPLTRTFVVDITEANGALRGQAIGQPAFGLRALEGDRFAILWVPAEISFERGAGGKVTALVLHQNGMDQRAVREELPHPSTEMVVPVETLREYVGEYPLAPRFVITISETEGALFAEDTGQGRAPLFASAKDEFSYKVVNEQISFTRDAAGKVTGLVLHQYGRDVPAGKK